MRKYIAGLATALTLLIAAPAQGQVMWDAPLLVSPSAPAGWGLYLVDPSPGDGIGVLSTWRGGGPLGFRLGLAEDRADNVAVYGGVDYSGRLIRASDDFPLDVDWIVGGGLSAGEDVHMGFPFGVSLGRAVDAEGIWFNPYFSPRVVLDAWIGRDDPPGDGLELNLAVDLGVDLAFDPGWAIRFGATVADRTALAIGFSFRLR
jgi:hypothetical protein